jgi:SAM-dependent methyltransferase
VGVAQIPWPSGARVLDIGCGAGWLWAEASAHLPGPLGLTLADLSPGMVVEAVDRVGRLGRHRRVDGQVADVQALPFAAESFDVVIANNMLYHTPDPALAVAELARVVRPAGVLMAATVGPGHLRELREIGTDVFGWSPSLTTVATFGIDVGQPILQSWFSGVEWRPYDDCLDCTDPEDVMAFLASTPPVEDATDEERQRVAAAVDRCFAAGGGRMRVSKETGVFLCSGPLAAAGAAAAD